MTLGNAFLPRDRGQGAPGKRYIHHLCAQLPLGLRQAERIGSDVDAGYHFDAAADRTPGAGSRDRC
jgi:hypothetical protein